MWTSRVLNIPTPSSINIWVTMKVKAIPTLKKNLRRTNDDFKLYVDLDFYQFLKILKS